MHLPELTLRLRLTADQAVAITRASTLLHLPSPAPIPCLETLRLPNQIHLVVLVSPESLKIKKNQINPCKRREVVSSQTARSGASQRKTRTTTLPKSQIEARTILRVQPLASTSRHRTHRQHIPRLPNLAPERLRICSAAVLHQWPLMMPSP